MSRSPITSEFITTDGANVSWQQLCQCFIRCVIRKGKLDLSTASIFRGRTDRQLPLKAVLLYPEAQATGAWLATPILVSNPIR